MSLAKKAGQAGALMLFRKGWGALVNIGVMAYLARTLDIADFGLVAISATLIGFIQTVGLAGISEYVIFYNEEDVDEKQNAAFWLNAGLTLIIAIIVLISAPFWADFYNDVRIEKIIWLLLVGFVFSMLSSIPIAIFRKKLEYKKMIQIQTVFGTISQLSQVAFAYLGFGVYSLAIPSAVVVPFLTVSLFWHSGYKINLKSIGIEHWRAIMKYTKHIIGGRILTKLVNEGDTLLIGKLLGLEALGIYDIAFKLANIINSNLIPIITNVSMPLFAFKNNDIFKVKKYYRNMIILISFTILPIFGGLWIYSADVVNLLYGNKWESVVLPLKILLIFAAARALGSPTSGLYNALGKPAIGFYFSLIFAPIFLIGVYFSSLHGLIVLCITVTTLRVLGTNIHFILAEKLLKGTIKAVSHDVMPVLFCLFLTIVITYFLKLYISGFYTIPIFVFSYILFFRLLFKEKFMYNINLLKMLTNISKSN